MTFPSQGKDYSSGIVHSGDIDPFYANMFSRESIEAFREADEIEDEGRKYGEPYLFQKAQERRIEALELMACAFGPSFNLHDKRLHIH